MTIPGVRPLQIGDPAPDFTAPDNDGCSVGLSGWRGRWVILFFFPRAAASHCQMQARRFQALFPEFQAAGACVVGVSSDTRQRQTEFRGLCDLSFPLISDRSGGLSRLYGVLDDPEPGEDVALARRETFLISSIGRIAHRWREVTPNVHAAEVLRKLRELQATSA
ncbi:peroxiredoxin [Deinococcus aetherius]|uniref:thioredoxin-dependent peroxiredoxin n=1 Tax=Deinococcus aetherius TaxID=200252 RepID=A0ABM8AHI9_9DEIO|nr:peroxiredoxin [Deinococcus aetherius]BDP43264.1 peroxiredoxin [Deinococcus aetherius]